MKNINKYLSIILAFFVCQLITINSFAQTKIEEETRSKCERCADYLNAKNMTDYAAEDCRVYSIVCTQLNNEPIILGKSTDTKSISLEAATQSLIIFTDGFDKVSYEVTPKVTILNDAKEEVATVETNIFQQYTIDEAGKLKMKGVSKIQKLGSEKRILMTNIELPEIETDNIYIQVEFLYFNPHNQQNEVAETIISQFEVQ